MNAKNDIKSYAQLSPSTELKEFVEVYWEHKNNSEQPNKVTIFPDSFFKLIIELTDGKVVAYFLTGLWTKEIEIAIPPKTSVYGIKFKILAPEYIFQNTISEILESHKNLDSGFLNIKNIKLDSFESIVNQLENKLINELKQSRKIEGHKLQLSQLLYKTNGEITAEEVSNQIAWSNRQINRYLNKWLGVSLKTYLNIQKVYASYIQIREGRFFPEKEFYDQAHFIKEVRKHTGHTPKQLHKEKDDRFIQLKNIDKK